MEVNESQLACYRRANPDYLTLGFSEDKALFEKCLSVVYTVCMEKQSRNLREKHTDHCTS